MSCSMRALQRQADYLTQRMEFVRLDSGMELALLSYGRWKLVVVGERASRSRPPKRRKLINVAGCCHFPKHEARDFWFARKWRRVLVVNAYHGQRCRTTIRMAVHRA